MRRVMDDGGVMDHDGRKARRTRHRALAGLAMLASLSTAACQGGDGTFLEITVRADADLHLDHVTVTINGGDRKEASHIFVVQPATGSATTAPDITWEVKIANLTSVLLSTIQVQGIAAGDIVVTSSAQANLVPRTRVEALLRLSSACRGVSCAVADQTCVDGTCGPRPVFGPAGSPGDGGLDVTADADAAGVDVAAADRAPSADARDADGPDGGNRPDADDGGVSVAVNGAACSKGSDCASGNCADSVCCDKPCTDACYSCRNALTASSPNGTCAVIASGQDDTQGRCGAPALVNTCGNTSHCDGKGACEKYGGTTVCAAAACSAGGAFTPASTCDGKGVCAASTAQDCKGFTCTALGGCATTCAVDADCTGGYCAPAKTCAAKKIDGSVCAANNECLHGSCVGGICCESACDGLCLSCANSETSAASGLCRPISAGGSSKSKCAVDTTACGHDGTCDGNGACRFRSTATSCGATSCANGQLRGLPLCDGAGTCSAAPAAVPCPGGVVCASATACKSAACVVDADCVSASYCLNGICTAKQANGGSCAANNQCALGNCLGTICCETACTGTCTSCLMADTGAADGLCRPIKAGGGSKSKCAVSSAAPCGNDGSCDGKGACAPAKSGTNCGSPACMNSALRAAPACDGAGVCVTPSTTTPCQGGVACGSAVACGATICAKDADCASGNYCALSMGGMCAPTKANGSVCTLSNECALGNCVGGICCETACGATCNSCAAADTGLAAGLCRPIKAGLSSKGKCAPGVAPCGQDGNCNGSGACSFPPATTSCGAPVCAGSQLKPGPTCNGSGTCGMPTAASCAGGVVCASTTACKSAACVADTDCVSGFCVSGTCTAKKANGQTCAAARECVSNACADGVCCNTACTGSCEFCNVSTALAGTCSLVTGAPRTGHTACTGTAPCASTCTGTVAACTFPTTSASCRAASCLGNVLTRAATCDGAGSCPVASTVSCNAFLCGGNACPTSCTANSQCVAGAACVSGACTACGAGQTVCTNACAVLSSDMNNCGACGHSCLSGACITGACQPFPIVTALQGVPGSLRMDGTNLFWTEADTTQVFVLNTATLVKRALFSAGHLTYRPDGDTIFIKSVTSFTSFVTCSLAANCATTTKFSIATTTNNDFEVDATTQRLLYVDLNIDSDEIQSSPVAAFNATAFLHVPLGFTSPVPLTDINGFLYGLASPVTGVNQVFWRASTATATNTAAILSTQIPPSTGFSLGQVGVTASKIFLFTGTSAIFSFPLNGSGSATPTTYFNPGTPGGFAVDETFVYWTDPVIGNVFRCPVAACTTPEIIASGQPGSDSLAQDAKALYWGQAQQGGMHQVMRLAK